MRFNKLEVSALLIIVGLFVTFGLVVITEMYATELNIITERSENLVHDWTNGELYREDDTVTCSSEVTNLEVELMLSNEYVSIRKRTTYLRTAYEAVLAVL